MIGTVLLMANFLQINLGRGREATDCMREFVRANGVDVVVLSEPFKRETEWKGFKRFGKPNAKSVIWVRESLRAWMLDSESSENVVRLILKFRDREVRVVDVYDEPTAGSRTNHRMREKERLCGGA